MSTAPIRTALSEALERDEEYADECDAAGRRDEARSTRARIERIHKALAAVGEIETAARTLGSIINGKERST